MPLPFASPCLSDAASVASLVASARGMGNDLAFANIYLLREKYKTHIALLNGFLFRYYGGHGRFQGYAFPCGKGDIEWALRQIEEDATFHARPCRFCLLTEADAAMLQQLRPGAYHFSTDPGDADYIYKRQDLAELPGTAFHKKRNHIARFYRQYANWHFAPLSAETLADARAVAEQWYAAREEDSPALAHEQCAIHAALRAKDELQLIGGVLYVDSHPVAMTLASHISPDAADIHYEKCLPSFRDAYPIINQEMARLLSCTYINREEDLNQAGLRQAKLSYRPALLLRKFNALPCSTPC